MPRYELVVFSNPVEGREEEYNRWYTDQHLADVLKVDGFVAAQRFRLSDHQRGPGPFEWRYLAVYELETETPQKSFAELAAKARTPEMPVSDAMAPDVLQYVFEPCSGRVVKP